MSEIRVGQRWKQKSTGEVWKVVRVGKSVVSVTSEQGWQKDPWRKQLLAAYTLIEEPADGT